MSSSLHGSQMKFGKSVESESLKIEKTRTKVHKNVLLCFTFIFVKFRNASWISKLSSKVISCLNSFKQSLQHWEELNSGLTKTIDMSSK